MKKVIVLFAIIAVFSFSASAQFSFTSKAGKKFSVSSPPATTDYRSSSVIFDYYYTVEDSDLVVYEVIRDKAKKISEVRTITVSVDTINKDSFKVREFAGSWILQTGKPYTRYTHTAFSDNIETYNDDNLQLTFKTREAAEAFRGKVLDDELGLGDLDLDLEDKPKEKPKSKMPAHLFALIGEGSKGTYQFNRKNMEVWDYKSNNVFKVGKIADSGSELKMLTADESYFTYRVKDGKLYNGNKFLNIELVDDNICKSYNGEKCFSKWEIDRDNEHIYSVFENGAKRYTQYKIMGEASDEEILLIFAYLEKF